LRGLREFSEAYFGEHRGYAQQYLFHHARATSRKSGAASDRSTSESFRQMRSSKNKNRSDRNRSRGRRASCQYS
jgi:hypothetical protein